MAIQVSYMDIHGLTHSEAYAKITQCSVGSESPIYFVVSIFVNEASKNANKQQLTDYQYKLSISDSNTYLADSVLKAENKTPINQAYTYLKTVDDSNGLGINWTTGITDV